MKKPTTEQQQRRALARERARCKRLALSIVNTFRTASLPPYTSRDAVFVCDDIIECICNEWPTLARRKKR